MINEQMSDLLKKFEQNQIFWYVFCTFFLNWSDSLIPSFLMSDVSESLRSLTKNEQCEQIAQVVHQKWATRSDSLRLLTINERPRANCSGPSPKMSEWANCSFFWANRSFAHLFAKKERFAQKTDEQIPSPGKRCTWAADRSFWPPVSMLENRGVPGQLTAPVGHLYPCTVRGVPGLLIAPVVNLYPCKRCTCAADCCCWPLVSPSPCGWLTREDRHTAVRSKEITQITHFLIKSN